MKFKDYYRLLGVAPEVSADDIKAAYRKLARKFHPDVNKDKDAHARFVEIGEAYEALGDPQKRQAYDRLRAMGFKEGQEIEPQAPSAAGAEGAPGDGARGGGFRGFEGFSGDFGGGHYTEIDPEDFSDFFQQIFGRTRTGTGRSRRAAFHERGEDVTHPLAVTLEEAYRGGQRRLVMRVPERDEHGRMRFAERTIDVKIPAGVEDGTKIRLKGQGEPGSDAEHNGDLYLELTLEPHRLFKVDGRTVHLELPVAPWEAVLGASVEVPTLGGPVTLAIPPGSQAGDKLRLRARGLPGDPPGDQIVALRIVVPPASEQDLAAWRQLAGNSRFNPRAGIAG